MCGAKLIHHIKHAKLALFYLFISKIFFFRSHIRSFCRLYFTYLHHGIFVTWAFA